MTVHGAKGLEATVVILADSCGAPDGTHDPKLFFVPDPARPALGRSCRSGRRQGLSIRRRWRAARSRVRAEAGAEHRRLLYVAMTRAEDRLIVAGHEGERARPEGNWYDMVQRVAERGGRERRADAGRRGRAPGLRGDAADRRAGFASGRPARSAAEPAWLRRAVAAEPHRRRHCARQAQARASCGSRRVGARAEAARRSEGASSIASCNPCRRSRRLAVRTLPAYLARRRHRGPAGITAALVEEVMAIIDDPAFADVFAPGGRAEVPIMGRLATTEGGLAAARVGPHRPPMGHRRSHPDRRLQDAAAARRTALPRPCRGDFIAQLAALPGRAGGDSIRDATHGAAALV